MPTDISPLTYGTFFHIYNRGNNGENIFTQERNYYYFTELWWKHISPIAETWSIGMLRNHFHATVWIKNREDLYPDLTGFIKESDDQGSRNMKLSVQPRHGENLSGLKPKELSQYFSNFFNAYSRGFNIANQRTGALFERPFKRIPVDNEKYLMRLIVYIHQNSQKHKFVTDFRDWNFSSYHDMISNNPTRFQREKVLQLFGSREDLIRIHQEIQPLENFEDED